MVSDDSDLSRVDEQHIPSNSPRLNARGQHALVRTSRAGTEEPEEADESAAESSGSDSEAPLPEHRRGDPTIIPWAHRIGVDPKKMHVMQASLFRAPETVETLKQLNAEKPEQDRLTPNGLHRKHSRDSEGEGLRTLTQGVRRLSIKRLLGYRVHTVVSSELLSRTMLNPSLFAPLVNMPG